MKPRRRLFLAGLAGLPAMLQAQPQAAWPTRPIRLIVVYPPGGISDSVARMLADYMAADLRVPVVVENRGGAGGSAGMEVLAKSPADGSVLAFSAISPLTLRPHLAAVRYDPLKDIEPVASVMVTPVLVVGTPAFNGTTLAELVRLAQARPGAVRWASSGHATAGHLVMEQVALQSQTKIVHVPYRGGGQPINDALGGQFEVLSTNMGPAQLAYVKAGLLKPLAVGAPSRLEALPQVPTFRELGFPLANLTSLFGVFAPAGTPDVALDRLNALINRILGLPLFREKLVDADNFAAGGPREVFAGTIAVEYSSNARIVKAANIRLE